MLKKDLRACRQENVKLVAHVAKAQSLEEKVARLQKKLHDTEATLEDTLSTLTKTSAEVLQRRQCAAAAEEDAAEAKRENNNLRKTLERHCTVVCAL